MAPRKTVTVCFWCFRWCMYNVYVVIRSRDPDYVGPAGLAALFWWRDAFRLKSSLRRFTSSSSAMSVRSFPSQSRKSGLFQLVEKCINPSLTFKPVNKCEVILPLSAIFEIANLDTLLRIKYIFKRSIYKIRQIWTNFNDKKSEINKFLFILNFIFFYKRHSPLHRLKNFFFIYEYLIVHFRVTY